MSNKIETVKVAVRCEAIAVLFCFEQYDHTVLDTDAQRKCSVLSLHSHLAILNELDSIDRAGPCFWKLEGVGASAYLWQHSLRVLEILTQKFRSSPHKAIPYCALESSAQQEIEELICEARGKYALLYQFDDFRNKEIGNTCEPQMYELHWRKYSGKSCSVISTNSFEVFRHWNLQAHKFGIESYPYCKDKMVTARDWDSLIKLASDENLSKVLVCSRFND